MHHRARDITGLRVGYLLALKYHGSNGRRSQWSVRCEACKSIVILAANDLVKMQAKGVYASCGCKKKETIGAKNTKHGMSRHPAYAVWRSMNDRCHLPSHQAWSNYGARGIRVCRSWRVSFDNFWTDMGPTYLAGLTLERKNNSGNYTPKNCEWATYKAQANNRRGSITVKGPWGSLTAAEFSERFKVKLTTLYYRLAHGVTGWALTEAADVTRKFST